MGTALAMPTVADALAATIRRLTQAGVPEPRADAELLVAHALGADRAGVIAAARRPLDAAAAARLDALVERRAAREPVFHLLGVREFWSLPIAVDARVLTPRPVTELLVETACRVARGARRVLDLGTGSGAVAAALAAELPAARVVAADRSADALAVARDNLRRLAPAVACVRGDWLASFRPATFDLVVANPPYVRDDELPGLDPEVRDAEPALALRGGADGLDAYRTIVPQAAKALAPGVWLAMEMGRGQARGVAALIRADGRFEAPALVRDGSDIERVVAVQRGGRWT